MRFFQCLFLLFLAFELAGVIDWPWYGVAWPLAAEFTRLVVIELLGDK